MAQSSKVYENRCCRFGSPIPLVQSREDCREMTDAERNDLITELDATHRGDIPWYSFDRLSPPTTPEIKNKRQSVHITFRRGVKRASLAKRLPVECAAKQSTRPPCISYETGGSVSSRLPTYTSLSPKALAVTPPSPRATARTTSRRPSLRKFSMPSDPTSSFLPAIN
jgi:hypothetical protein